MAEVSLHIARAGAEIGVFDLADVRARLAAGALLPTDHYWKPGMAAWQTLAALPGTVRTLPFPRPVEKKANLLDGMLGRESYQAGLVAVWDLLAAAPVECVVADEKWEELRSRLGYDVRRRCREDLAKWYGLAAEAYLSDRYFAPEEKTDLANLARSLGLDAAAAEAIHGEAFSSYFNVGFQTCLLRDVAPQRKAEEIALLSRQVPLSASRIAEIRQEALERHFGRKVDTVAAQDDGDEIIDPAAADALFVEAAALGFPLSEHLPKLAGRLHDGTRVWKLYRAPLTEVPCDLDVGSEGCFWTKQVIFAQNKRITVRRSYGGFGTSIKIWGPIRYRSGSYQVERETEDQVVQVDTGTLVFTSKRVIFSGGLKSFNFKLSKVLDVTSYANAIVVDKDTGGDAIFLFDHGQAEAAVILRRLVRQAKG